jgi:outer membrane lipoprotein SlyB
MNQNSPVQTAAKSARLHPLMALAAMCVIALSVTGVAAMTGLLKTSKAESGSAPLAVSAPLPPEAAAPTPPAKAQAQPRAVSRPAPVAAAPREYDARPAPVVAQNVGVVESIREVKTPGQGTGLGAVAGGVLGGVLGNQVGGGNGKKAMTVIGAVGGGVLGNHVEKNARATVSYSVTVRMDNGERRTMSLARADAWRVGDRVKVENGQIIATQAPYAPVDNRNTAVDYKG